MSGDERALLKILKNSLKKSKKKYFITPGIFDLAKQNSVVSLIYDSVETADPRISQEIDRITRSMVLQSYHLLFETVKICDFLTDAGIKTVVLKGAAVSSFYPVPEYRKSGDIDLLVGGEDELRRAAAVMKKNGYAVAKEQHALHHIVFDSPFGIEVEIHKMLAEPFDNRRINEYMDRRLKYAMKGSVKRDVCGFPLRMLGDDFQAFELLLHMLQHFLFSGFGLKLLCDWVVYWNGRIGSSEDPVTEKYLHLVREARISGFSDMITSVCYYFLGLSDPAYRNLTRYRQGDPITVSEAAAFLREVFDGGDFGHAGKERMLILRDSSFISYVIAFQHQMYLNFPKAGKVPPLWPALWTVTLLRFFYNNKKVRGGESAVSIIKNAGKRSRIMSKLSLWRR